MPQSNDDQHAAPNQDITAVMPGFMQGATPSTLPAFAPGQRAALASQLGAGFGQTPAAFGKWLDMFNTPAQSINFKPGSLGPAKPTTKPGGQTGGTVVTDPRTGKIIDHNNPNNMVVVNGRLVPESQAPEGYWR